MTIISILIYSPLQFIQQSEREIRMAREIKDYILLFDKIPRHFFRHTLWSLSSPLSRLSVHQLAKLDHRSNEFQTNTPSIF